MSFLMFLRVDMVLLKKPSVLFCVAVYLLTIGGMEGAVLCIGTGGHLHIEMETAKAKSHHHMAVTANALASHHASDPTAFPCAGQHCVSCVDIPLFSNSPDHQPSSTQFKILAHSQAGAVSSSISPAQESTATTGISAINHAGNSSLASLRSVILLI